MPRISLRSSGLRSLIVGTIGTSVELARKGRQLVLQIGRPAFDAFENVSQGFGFHGALLARRRRSEKHRRKSAAHCVLWARGQMTLRASALQTG
ncbi:hypothetical protein RPC_2378 [Rhodopseudomonas palustris BisB18]|uniref:Uncharacterized protein n=1 Tax=Rhodopseudomonas palustris (strain BisB18) TaxID=316056 RepID=Q215K5_RHOPB